MTFETIGVIHVLFMLLTTTTTATMMVVVVVMMLTTAGVAAMLCFLGVAHIYSNKMQIWPQN